MVVVENNLEGRPRDTKQHQPMVTRGNSPFEDTVVPVLSQNTGKLSNSLYEASVTTNPKPDRLHTQKQNRLVSLMNSNTKYSTSKQNPTAH